MPEAEDDLRATSEAVQDDAERLADLEARKLALSPDDPEVDKLSHEIHQLARAIGHKAEAERELAEEVGRGDATAGPGEGS
jgi:hypothetical protein